MSNSIIVISLKSKKISKPIKRNPLKCIMSTNSMQINQNSHHDISQWRKMKRS